MKLHPPSHSSDLSAAAPASGAEGLVARMSVRISQFQWEWQNRRGESRSVTLTETGTSAVMAGPGETKWKVESRSHVAGDPGRVGVELTVTLLEGKSPSTAVAIDVPMKPWSVDNYVLMPAVAYNGNRFESRRIAYSPKLLDPRDIGPDKPIIISDVPRLNVREGMSRIQDRSGAMSRPGVGVFSPREGRGVWILSGPGCAAGDFGYSIEENRDRTEAVISITAPVVREGNQYFANDNEHPSRDRAPDWEPGKSVTIRLEVVSFKAECVQDLYSRYWELRGELVEAGGYAPFAGFSRCFEVIEEKFNRQNFVPEHGYYAVGMRENPLQDWAIGWTGGMISTYPLLAAGSATSVANVIRNFEWLFRGGISPSGFFWDLGAKGTIWYGGDYRKPHTVNWHLVRKSGDAVYFICKQLQLMERRQIEVKPEWKAGTRGVCEAFVKVWRKWGQFGQFVDSLSGDIAVGGSTSGAIVPGALALASEYFGERVFLEVAQASAERYYEEYVRKGITCGGPGDALQNPDSESAYAMVESFVQLYETTGEKKWLKRAGEAAEQYASWVMPYNYAFPAESTFGKLGIRTTGSVFANTQNKHSAPAICTFSGHALLRLSRYTGERRYGELLRETAFHLPQYLALPERPIPGLQTGWMNERVNTTDWNEPIGELFPGSTWVETSMMLTAVEVPGVYWRTDRGELTVFDNVEARLVEVAGEPAVHIRNRTGAAATVTVLAEDAAQAGRRWNETWFEDAHRVVIPARGETTVSLATLTGVCS